MTGRGYLFVPPGHWTKVVLISHGSQGLDARHFEHADALTRSGISAFVMEHWTPRGLAKVTDFVIARAHGASLQSEAADAIWAMAALQARHSQIESFGFLGESMGGSAATVLDKEWIHTLIKPPQVALKPLKGIAGLYPGCFEETVGERYTDAPLLLVVGEKDDNTPAAVCADLAR